jgi:hypothetical protein
MQTSNRLLMIHPMSIVRLARWKGKPIAKSAVNMSRNTAPTDSASNVNGLSTELPLLPACGAAEFAFAADAIQSAARLLVCTADFDCFDPSLNTSLRKAAGNGMIEGW